MGEPEDLLHLLEPTAPIQKAVADAGAPPAASAVAAGGAASGIVGGAYEGSSRFDQLALWRPPLVSADRALLPEKDILDARAQDLIRNDAYVAGGATLHKDNIVGAFYLLNARPSSRILFGRQDDTWEREFQEEVEEKFTLWAESPENWLDAQRTKTLTGMVRLALGVFAAGGEVLATSEWMPNDGRAFRSALQMVSTARLSTPWDRQWDQDIRNGVERDFRGAPQAYWIRRSHPADYNYTRLGMDLSARWMRIPARKPWGRPLVLHIYEQREEDQSRGVSEMVGALAEMRMTKSFRRVQLQQAVTAATYAASIESDLPEHEVLMAMGGDGGDNAALGWMQSYLQAIEEYSGGSRSLLLDGQKIPVFMPGTKLKLQNPGNSGPLGDKFEQSLLRHIAAALGVSYEQLARDYTQTNYSSARAAMGETYKFLQARKKIVADRVATFIYRQWLEEAINQGSIEALRRRDIPRFYDGQNADAYSACDWIGAGQGTIDPLKETQAYVLQLEKGLTTRERVIAKLHGADWRKDFRQMSREADLARQYGVSFSAEATPTDNQEDEQTARGEGA